MALNPIVYIERIVRSFLRYQLTAYPFQPASTSQPVPIPRTRPARHTSNTSWSPPS